jgi:segregation and condensation protein A
MDTAEFEISGPLVDAKGQFLLDLEGYAGPIDALLQMARDQKVDLTRISILSLAEQFLAFVQRARHMRLELAADYLVMAAWLAYLKSRLLLPELESEEEPSGAEMAAALRFQLQRLEAMQKAGKLLFLRPQRDQDFFARGQPEALRVVSETSYDCKLYDLLRAYGRVHRPAKSKALRIRAVELYSVDAAVERLSRLFGPLPGWHELKAFLPQDLGDGLFYRSAIAMTFAASLEMAKSGRLDLRQDGPFKPIFLQGKTAAESEKAEADAAQGPKTE